VRERERERLQALPPEVLLNSSRAPAWDFISDQLSGWVAPMRCSGTRCGGISWLIMQGMKSFKPYTIPTARSHKPYIVIAASIHHFLPKQILINQHYAD
jgi:hypothetical protein